MPSHDRSHVGSGSAPLPRLRSFVRRARLRVHALRRGESSARRTAIRPVVADLVLGRMRPRRNEERSWLLETVPWNRCLHVAALKTAYPSTASSSDVFVTIGLSRFGTPAAPSTLPLGASLPQPKPRQLPPGGARSAVTRVTSLVRPEPCSTPRVPPRGRTPPLGGPGACSGSTSFIVSTRDALSRESRHFHCLLAKACPLARDRQGNQGRLRGEVRSRPRVLSPATTCAPSAKLWSGVSLSLARVFTPRALDSPFSRRCVPCSPPAAGNPALEVLAARSSHALPHDELGHPGLSAAPEKELQFRMGAVPAVTPVLSTDVYKPTIRLIKNGHPLPWSTPPAFPRAREPSVSRRVTHRGDLVLSNEAFLPHANEASVPRTLRHRSLSAAARCAVLGDPGPLAEQCPPASAQDARCDNVTRTTSGRDPIDRGSLLRYRVNGAGLGHARSVFPNPSRSSLGRRPASGAGSCSSRTMPR